MLALGLGSAGVLNGVVGWVTVVTGWLLGLARLMALLRVGSGRLASHAPRPERWLLLLLVVPMVVGMFAATLPPGVLWAGENRAYDVLEYHLQAPREYFDAGRVHFLPHNVYASFPQQMEMLYLLLMHMTGGPLAGALPAQFCHLLLAALTVVALCVWTPSGWPRLTVALVAGAMPWLAYLGSLAYVEMGMLFFAAVAAGLASERLREAEDRDWRLPLAVGLCAGLAGGCKYTALVLVAVALAGAWLVTMRGGAAVRGRRAALLGAGVLVAFSPWLIRNAACTGNPVYPFAYGWFGGAAWSVEQNEQWARGHRLPEGQDTAMNRLRTVGTDLLAAPMFGRALFVLAVLGLIVGRDRPACFAGVWLVLSVLLWMTLTHMPPRFAVPAIVPAALLAGRAAGVGTLRPARVIRAAAVVIAVAGALAGSLKLAALLRAELRYWSRFEYPLTALVGETELVRQAQLLNHCPGIPAGARVWLVGESRAFYLPPGVHYTVVFSRDAWLTYAATRSAGEAVGWLRTQGVGYVVFSWDEIGRLRTTYGFPAWVTPEWVRSCVAAGLRRVVERDDASGQGVAVYEVLPK